MYEKKVPYKDLANKPQNKTLYFHLYEREVFQVFPQLKSLFDWTESLQKQEVRVLDAHEVKEFYSNLEEVLLQAIGYPSDDMQSFSHDARYDLEKHAAFNALMIMFLSDQVEAMAMLDAIIPSEGLKKMIQDTDESVAKAIAANPDNPELQARLLEAQAEIERLKQSPSTPAAE